MKHLTELMDEACQSCSFRGHEKMNIISKSTHIAVLQCPKCYRYVICIEKPAPNQIDIGGDAVAVNCSSPKETV